MKKVNSKRYSLQESLLGSALAAGVGMVPVVGDAAAFGINQIDRAIDVSNAKEEGRQEAIAGEDEEGIELTLSRSQAEAIIDALAAVLEMEEGSFKDEDYEY